MGAFMSTSKTGIPSQQELDKATQNGKEFVTVAFQYMSKELNMKDILLMANPAKCSEMILLTAALLKKTLHSYRYAASSTHGGQMLYFFKLDDFEKRKKGELTEDTQKLCITIAMFYIRIFQIYGALSLTILDVALVENQAGGSIQEGGRLTASEPPLPGGFNYLRDFLTSSSDYYILDGTAASIRIVILKRSIVTKTSQSRVTIQIQEGRSKIITITCDLAIDDRDRTVVFRLSNFGGIPSLKPTDSTTITFSKGGLIGSTELRAVDAKLRGLSIPDAFQNKIIDIISSAGGLNDRDRERRGIASVSQIERSIDEHLRTESLWSMFDTGGKPTKPHCISRALQLVGATTLIPNHVPTAVFSSICKTGFMSTSGSLPGLTKEVKREKGIFVLNQLYYEMLDNITPKIATDAGSAARYEKMRNLMQHVFSNPSGTTFDQLKDLTASGYCGDKKDKTVFVQDTESITSLRKKVETMLRYQLDHTAKVVTILNKLFLKTKTGGYVLHPTILAGGINEVNKIGREAQDILLEYYGTCEMSYKEGVNIITRTPRTIS